MVFVASQQNVTHGKIVVKLIGGFSNTHTAATELCWKMILSLTLCEYVIACIECSMQLTDKSVLQST